MTNLLSLFVAIAMMFSGGYLSEDPNAAASTMITIRDAVVRYDGGEYPLSPTLTFGASTENGAALIDFGMPLGENVLFPVQAKIDDSGLGVLLGNSSTAYTFTPEFFDALMDGAEIPAEITEMLETEAEMLRAAAELENFQLTPEQNQQITQDMIALLDDYKEEDGVTGAIDGEELTGKRTTFTLDTEEMAEMIDMVYSYMPAGYMEAYLKSMSMSLGQDIDSMGSLFTLMGVEMTAEADMFTSGIRTEGDINMTVTTDPEAMLSAMNSESVGIIGGADGPTSIIVTAVATEETTATENANPETEAETEAPAADNEVEMVSPGDTFVVETEPVTMTFPMHMSITQESETKATTIITTNMEMPDDGISLDMRVEAAVDGQAADVSVIVSATDPVETVTATVNVVSNPADENAHDYFGMHVTDGEMIISISVDSQAHESGSITAVDFDVVAPESGDEFIDFGASFVIDESHPVIASRFDGADVSPIATLEDAEESTGLAMAAMGMMGDVEKLMNDESIMALVELFSANLTAEADVGVSVQAADNTRPLPEFAWLPEGFTLTEDESYAYDGYISANFYDEAYNSITVYMYDNYTPYDLDATHTYYVLKDGAAQPADGSTLHIVHAMDDYGYSSIEATGQLDNWNISMNAYGVDLTDDEIVQLLSGITFPEVAEEVVEEIPAE